MSNHEREGLRSPNSDAALDRAWQQASDEQPSPQLDATIIAAARTAVQDRVEQPRVAHVRSRSRSWLARWQPLAAAAAVAGLAFVLVQSLPRERGVAPSMRSEEPAQVPATTQEMPRSPPAPATTDQTTATSPPALADAHEPRSAPGRERAKQAIPVTGTTVAIPATDAEMRNAATAKMATGVASAEVATAAAQESRQVVPAPRSAADPAANIASLYAAGDVAGAAAALRAFRAATPDADTHLPESLRDWARTVQ